MAGADPTKKRKAAIILANTVTGEKNYNKENEKRPCKLAMKTKKEWDVHLEYLLSETYSSSEMHPCKSARKTIQEWDACLKNILSQKNLRGDELKAILKRDFLKQSQENIIKNLKVSSTKEEALKRLREEKCLKKPKIDDDNEKPLSKRKKKKSLVSLENIEMPKEYMKVVEKIAGVGTQVKLVVHKEITKTDTERHQNRLNMPSSHLEEILTPAEVAYLKITTANFIEARLIEPRHVDHETNRSSEDDDELPLSSWIQLKEWKLGDQKYYVLSHQWYTVVKENNIQKYDVYQVWAFRYQGGQLGLVLVRVLKSNNTPEQ